jgi:hypothetical protein
MSVQVYSPEGECRRYEKLSSITASIGFTSAKIEYKGRIAQAALITVETAAIRFTMDGTTPVVTGGSVAGHKMDAGQSFVVRGTESIRNFRCINESASNGAVVFCSYYF